MNIYKFNFINEEEKGRKREKGKILYIIYYMKYIYNIQEIIYIYILYDVRNLKAKD